MSARNYLNTATPVGLASGIDDTTPTLPVPSTAGYPTAPFTLALQRGSDSQEFCLCTSKGPTSFTVQRGYDGTDAIPHDIASPVEHCVGALDYTEANFHINNQAHDQHTQYLRKDLLTAKGSLYVATASGTIVQLAIGADGTVLVADSGQSKGMLWGSAIPTGSLIMFAGGSAPAGYLLSNGAIRTKGVGGTDDPLYQVIGSVFNTGGESTDQFRLPNLCGRMPIGVGTGSGLTARALGGIGGAEGVALIASQLAQHAHTMAHSHTANQGDHHHGVPGSPVDYGFRFVVSESGAQSNYLYASSAASGNRGQGVTFSTTSEEDPNITVSGSTAANTGTAPAAPAVAHENMSPFIAINFLIKR